MLNKVVNSAHYRSLGQPVYYGSTLPPILAQSSHL